ncbi:hypothetical protein GPJ56_000895 [Histomonas meleagridis]|uniref:uncharacterized protein n=1 Tax=Histomonas meleagridis TaxID=135588 RepID=UPI00355AAB52|nr:hypothetical protein GPJ56_000895 [Histomonas meleagridis]KAH0801275.1 hypothetical protein GO595_005870 [Histomonas meleagridis]
MMTLCLILTAVTVFWIMYAIFISGSTQAGIAGGGDHLISYSQYQQKLEKTNSSVPYLIFVATATYFNRDYEYMECEFAKFVYEASSMNTTRDLPNFNSSDYAWVQADVHVTLTDEQQRYVDQFEATYRSFLPSQIDGRDLSYEYSMGAHLDHEFPDSIEKKPISLYLVTENGKAEGKYNYNLGRAMMALWSGIGYLFRLSSIPVYPIEIIASDVQFKDLPAQVPPANDTFWDGVRNPNCHRYV